MASMIRFAMGAALLLALGGGCASPQPSASSPEDQASAVALLKQQEAQLLAEKDASFSGDAAVHSPRLLPIQSGDRIRIEIWLKDRISQLSGFPLETVVPETGDVFLPHQGAIQVAGQTTPQLTATLQTMMNPILQDAHVVVTAQREKVLSRDQREGVVLGNHVVVLGFVQRPGIYAAQPGLRVRDVLAMAGDFTRNANKTVFLVRGDRLSPEVLRVRMDDVLRGRDMSQNVLLAANDAIYVSPKKMWEVADFISTLLMPIVSVRDAYWVYDRVME